MLIKAQEVSFDSLK